MFGKTDYDIEYPLSDDGLTAEETAAELADDDDTFQEDDIIIDDVAPDIELTVAQIRALNELIDAAGEKVDNRDRVYLTDIGNDIAAYLELTGALPFSITILPTGHLEDE